MGRRSNLTRVAKEPQLRPDLLMERVEALRQTATLGLAPETRSELGQFLTPAPVARFMRRIEDIDDGLAFHCVVESGSSRAGSRGNRV